MADEEKKLLMDLESRLARAKEMGFDLPVYHGTDADIKEFIPGEAYHGKGIYTSPHEQLYKVNEFTPKEGGAIYPLMIRGKKIFNTGEGVIADEVLNKIPSKRESFELLSKLSNKSISELENMDRYTLAKVIQKYPEHFQGLARSSEIVTFDPKNIRSKFAAFDPAKSESADLSAFTGKKPKFPSIGKALGVAGTISDISNIAHGDVVEGALGLGSMVAGRASPYLGTLRPEKTVSEEQEMHQLEENKELKEKEEEAKYRREALKRLMSSQED